MIDSMTGFGRAEASGADKNVFAEIRSVNHRYLDLSVKMPRRLGAFEADVREYLKKNIARGKVEVRIIFEDLSEGQKNLRYDPIIAKSYIESFERMEKELGIKNDVSVSLLSRMDGVFETQSNEELDDDKELKALVLKAVEDAYTAFSDMRQKEGEALKKDLYTKLDGMLSYVSRIEDIYPQVVEEYRKSLYEKVNEILKDSAIDESRVASEVIIYADKICVDEETVRLRTHIESMKKTLSDGGAVGRKLDFIAQEMNRESNTILSKSSNADIADIAIEMKTDVEKIREQVQNIE